MSRVHTFVSSLSVLALALGVGCSGAPSQSDGALLDEVSDEEALSTKVTEGTFRLYNEPNASVDSFCDSHTELVLSNAKGARATLTNKLTGACELAVVPDVRYYKLRFTGTSCGSKNYEGTFTKDGVRRTIQITDHRSRTCRDLRPAKLMVEETRKASAKPAVTTELFSLDRALINYDAFDANKPQTSEAKLDSTELGKALEPVLDGLEYTSEGDYPVRYFTHAVPMDVAIDQAFIVSMLKSRLTAEVFNNGEDWNDLTSEQESTESTVQFVKQLADYDAAFAALFSEMSQNLRSIKLIKVGPKGRDGKLGIDRGLYTYVLVGWSKNNDLAGVFFGSVET